MRPTAFLTALTLSLSLVGCGDFTGSVGELGRLRYGLRSDYLVDVPELTAAEILTRHEQRIAVWLTEAGDDRTDDEEQIRHEVVDGFASVDTEEVNEGTPDFHIVADEPGEVVIESSLDGQLFDRITLNFNEPATLDLITWTRDRNDDDFDRRSEPVVPVGEGTQAAFVPVPLNAAGQRIVGDFVVQTAADPEWTVAFSTNVLGIYEQQVVHALSPASVYFIEPGAVSVTLTDEPNGVSAEQPFEVEPVDQPQS